MPSGACVPYELAQFFDRSILTDSDVIKSQCNIEPISRWKRGIETSMKVVAMMITTIFYKNCKNIS